MAQMCILPSVFKHLAAHMYILPGVFKHLEPQSSVLLGVSRCFVVLKTSDVRPRDILLTLDGSEIDYLSFT